MGDACALQDCTACLAASGEPPCSSSRPAAPALSTAAAGARGLAARATLGRLPCGTAPSQRAPPPTPTLPTRGSRRRPAAGLGLVYIVGQWTASAGCGVQRRARSTVYRLPGPPTRRSQRGWGASASAGGLAGPGRPSGLDSGASLRWGDDPWGLVVAQHPPRCSVPLRWFLKCMCAGALAG